MAKYISKYLELRIVEKASYHKEVEGRVIVVPGKSIQFRDGVYETEDKDEIAFLESHPNFGSVFIKVKDKDLAKVKEELNKDLEKKEAELKAKEAELAKREKALEEGAEMPKKRGRQAKVKEEKPEF